MSSTPAPSGADSPVRMWALRLSPGADLKQALIGVVAANGLEAAFIAACVGSLSAARLRMPSAPGEPAEVLSLAEPMEIVSLAGTLSPRACTSISPCRFATAGASAATFWRAAGSTPRPSWCSAT